MVSEHIVIADELADLSIEPTRLAREETIRNRVNGVVTDVVFFDEGFVRVRETRKGRTGPEHLVELRFLDPKPVSGRRTAAGMLWSSLVLGLAALVAAFVLPVTSLAGFTVPATAVAATLAIVALLLSVYRSQVRYQFFTASGRAVVLTLKGSFGCKRRVRSVAKAIADAIRIARKDAGTHDVDYLRAEMKAHYRLAETGVITRKACSDGTRLILSKFD